MRARRGWCACRVRLSSPSRFLSGGTRATQRLLPPGTRHAQRSRGCDLATTALKSSQWTAGSGASVGAPV
jgi:hypothetical protein